MSIILQSGDKVHLVIPGMFDRHGNRDHEANASFERSTRQLYASQGVDAVIITTVTSNTPISPAVVAVFREPKKSVPLPKPKPLPVYDSLEQLMAQDPNPERGRTVMVGDLRYVSINGEWVQV